MEQKHAYAQELRFQKKIKLVETFFLIELSVSKEHILLTSTNSSKLVLIFFSERRTITGLNLLPLSNCKQGCHQLSLCVK